MGTVIKSVRVDERMLDIIERYKKEMKKMLGIKVSTSGILSDSVVYGFQENLKFIRLLTSKGTVINEPNEFEITEEMLQLIQDYEELLMMYLIGEDV